MKLNWFIPIALLIPLRLSATDATVGARVATITINPREITVLHLRPEFESTMQFEGQFNQISSLFHVNVSSATLPQSQNLESLLLSRNAANVPTVSGQFQNVYGVVMPQNAASPQMRTMTDMTDAQAQDAMKRAIEIDALADAELNEANQMGQQISQAAPGSAPILEAEADVWVVRANAYTASQGLDQRLNEFDGQSLCRTERWLLGAIVCVHFMVGDKGISETTVLVFRRSVNQQGFTQREVMVLPDAHVDLHESPPSNRSAAQSGWQAPC